MTEIITTSPESARVAAESAEVQSKPTLSPDIDLAMTETVGEVDEVVFSALKGFRRYQIVRAPKEKLDEWKRGVDEIIPAIASKNLPQVRELMKRNGTPTGDADTIEKIITEEDLDDTDVKLLAIGLFVLREKSPWHVLKSGLKILKGGRHRMESAFERDEWANCYDIAAIVNELAGMYGIDGKLHGRGLSHSHFETKDGKISDPMYGWRRGGIFQTKARFDKFKKDMGLLRRMGLKRG